MKTVLFVILDQYADWEGAYLSSWIMAFGKSKYCVKTVSLDRGNVSSIGGFTAVPDYDLQSVPDDFEAVILIGGFSWRTDTARQVLPLVEKALAGGKVLGAICDAAAFLGTAGILNDVRHTGNDLDDLKRWAGEAYRGEEFYVMQPAVRDKNIVTANGTATLEFAKEVMTALGMAPEEKVREWYEFYKRGVYEAPMPTL